MMTLFADVFITGLSNASVTEVRDVLMATFATTDLGDVPLVMGVEVKRNMEPGTIELDQGKYTRSVIERFEMSDCNPVYTTGTEKEFKSQPDGNVPLDEQAIKLYQAMGGSLLFLTSVRDSILCLVQYNLPGTCPNPRQCVSGVKMILRYLRGTPNPLTIYKKHSSFSLVGFHDAFNGLEDPEK